MEALRIPHSELPHTSKLFADLLYNFGRVASFYAHDASDPDAFARAARDIRMLSEQRAALVAALRLQNPGHPALERLAREGTVAVVTGQQVGLYGGPAFTVYKALTAAKLARELTERGLEAVPVFWLATEDHDFEEVRRAWSFTPDHRPVELELPAARSAETPVGTIGVGSPPHDALRQSLCGFPFGEDVAALAAESYREGESLGGAFRKLAGRLLGSHEVLFLDPLAPEIRALAAPVLARAVEAAPDLTAALLERNRALESAGYHAQVHLEPHTALFFVLERGRRIALRRNGVEYAARDRRYSVAELHDRAVALSPNALLRPVVQDSILPTVAYVGGPAELAYLAQSRVLYEHLLGRMPVPVPRSAFTILDARSAKLMACYELRLQDFFHGLKPLEDQIARRLAPPGLKLNFQQTISVVGGLVDGLSRDLLNFDPSLKKALEKSRAKILYQLHKIEGKAAREALRRDERAQRDAAYVSGLVYPEKHLQERRYSILPFLARHGRDLVGRLYERIRLDSPHHQVFLA